MDSRSTPQRIGEAHGADQLATSGTFGLPPRDRDLHRQNKRKPARCQRITVSGLTITRAFRTFGAIL